MVMVMVIIPIVCTDIQEWTQMVGEMDSVPDTGFPLDLSRLIIEEDTKNWEKSAILVGCGTVNYKWDWVDGLDWVSLSATMPRDPISSTINLQCYIRLWVAQTLHKKLHKTLHKKLHKTTHHNSKDIIRYISACIAQSVSGGVGEDHRRLENEDLKKLSAWKTI